MNSRPVLTALLVASLTGPASASSWICSDPETEALRAKVETMGQLLSQQRAADAQLRRELRQVQRESVLLQEIRGELEAKVRRLKSRLAVLELGQQIKISRRGWAEVLEDLRRDGDVNVGLIPVLERMDSRGRSSRRLRSILHRLARYDGVIEAALETPAPEREMERLGLILDRVEHHADRLAAEVVRRLEGLQDELGSEFSPSHLPEESLDDDFDFFDDADDDFGDF